MRTSRGWVASFLVSLVLPGGLAADEPAPLPGVHALRSIDPADEDFADLAPLAQALGSARVVILGEASHGDGAAFLAKARLIRFLHQRLGFDALAWEAGFFDCREMAAGLAGAAPLSEVAARCLYTLWWQAREIEPTLTYLRQTQATTRPIRLVGFDSRVSTRQGREVGFPSFVAAFFDRLDPALLSAQDRQDLAAMSTGLVPADYFAKPGPRPWNRALPQRLLATLDARRTELARFYSGAEIDWARQALVSFLAMDRALEALPTPYPRYTRDTAMAENLLWWLEGPLAQSKVIVWAHNYHAMVGGFGSWTPELEAGPAGPMGRFLRRELGDAVYAVGFTAHHGQWGYAGEAREPVPDAGPGSLEHLLHATGARYAFLDLRTLPPDHPLRQPLASTLNLYEPMTFVWPKLFDGLLFLDEMRPATGVGAP
jgi:erythromycin esterase